MSKSSIKEIFRGYETSQLFGAGNSRLWLMSLSMLVAVLAIGFATSSLTYLEEKMKNPFVTCVDIVVDQLWSNGYEELDEFVTDQRNLDSFSYGNPEKVWLLSEDFQKKDKRTVRLDGRTINMSSPILKSTIFAPENTICSKDTILDEDFGIILSNEGLKKLEMTEPSFVVLPIYIDDSTDCEVSVPVLAIVNELPDMCDFLMTHGYAKHVLKADADHFNVSTANFNIRMHLVCSKYDYDEVLSVIESRRVFEMDTDIPTADNESWNTDYLIVELFTDSANKFELYNSLADELKSKFDNLFRVYQLSGEAEPDNYDRKPQIYSCYFSMNNRLPDNVEGFRASLKKSTGHRLDMSKIDSLKNLAKVQTLGSVLSWCIFGISIFFIVIFIYFMMSMHFQKIQKNLGTFKAFGISTSTLKNIYSIIIMQLVGYSFGIAAAVAAAVTIPINLIFPRDGAYDWVNIFVWQNGVLLCVALIAAWVTVWLTANRLLKRSPGNLIYDR